MISQVFVSPDSFGKVNDFTVINSLLNDIQNHPIFVIDFDKINWVKYIRNEYLEKEYDSKERDILIRKLVSLDKAKKIFKRQNYSIEVSSELKWLDILELSNRESPLNLIITGSKYFTNYQVKFPNNVEDINNIVISSEKWDKVKFTNTAIKKTPSDYNQKFGEILKNSKKIKIVDVYIGKNFKTETQNFHPDDKTIIELFSKLLATNKVGKGSIEIHTMLDESLNISHDKYVMSKEDREKKIAEVYASNNNLDTKRSYWITVINKLAEKFGHEYKVYFWSNRQSNSTFHDRYIFTDIIAVSPGHSISASEKSDQDTLWKVLNKTERDEQEFKYDINDPYFILSCKPIEIN